MRIKKFGGKVYGADLTAAEQKALNAEIQRQLAEHTRAHLLELDAVILWVLHAQFGWGKKRLRRFYDRFRAELNALLKRYEMGDDDKVWLCTFKLKELGVDVEEWSAEKPEP